MSEKIDANAVRNAQLRELAPLHDIPLQISIEIGRMKFKVRDLLRLAPNEVIELKKPAGEPLEICINGHHVARGEVIVVEQTSGVRIIEVFKPGASMAGALEP
jgi:flagellar motor switch protein FliN/FliY